MVDPNKERKVGFTEKERRTEKVRQTLTQKIEADIAKRRKKENPKVKELEEKAKQLEAAGLVKSAERLRKDAERLK